jgi:hypothetical protein
MPNILEPSDIDQVAEQEDMMLTAAEEEYEATRYSPTENPQDLSNGGTVNGIKVRPSKDHNITIGRSNSRRAWMWDGTESLLPLGWDSDGKIHNGAKYHFEKRHCVCCKFSGFRGRHCPRCVASGCAYCNGSSDPKKIIPNFYPRPELVPYPVKFYGSIDCFLPFCERRGDKGFKTEEDMRMHARTRHRMEYQTHLEVQTANKGDEMDILRNELAEMRHLVMSQSNIAVTETSKQPQSDRAKAARVANIGKAQAAKKAKKAEREAASSIQ